jgi:3',5'-cyclic AMP phosphodiesterase CpdA
VTTRLLLAALAVLTACGRGRLAAPAPNLDPEIRQMAPTDSGMVLLAAGDIAACTGGSMLTAQLLDSIPGDIIVPGDAAYVQGDQPDPYSTCYATTWGRHKSRTHPVPGNHDAEPAMVKLYFTYFGAAAGPQPGGYYSFEVGDWHVMALNSTIPMDRDSEQGRWILRDLAANPRRCTLAFMHHPRFSSGPHSKNASVEAAFEMLARGGVDVLVSGHDHIYERFAPMRPSGARDDRDGVRQFVVGTGGNALYTIRAIQRHSQKRQIRVHGVLKLTLRATDYSWQFVPASPTPFDDRGTTSCH